MLRTCTSAKNVFAFILLMLTAVQLYAQVPTTADCLGAIPICQNQYSYSQSPSGEGNYPNEINSATSCLGSGELNDTWYTFTVQQSGNLCFSITPNALSDDYDWAVYDLTTNNCSDIFNNAALEVSCNYDPAPGVTGPNGQTGAQNNPCIPVTAGQTYVINVSNFSSSANGYTIDFGASTAVIFDQTPPQILSSSSPGCGGNTITVTFSENILCNTVQNGDFSLSGPGGPYTVTSVTSAACAAGAQYDNSFTITVSPAITSSGSFSIDLIGPVTDLCTNVATFPASLNFNISAMSLQTSTTAASCGQQDGSATVTPTGQAPYTYSWNTTPVQTTQTATNLGAGTYIVTVTDAGGCQATATVTVTATGSTTLSLASQTNILCNGQCTGSATVSAAGGPAPYTYSWSTTPVQATATAANLCAGTYTATVTDATGCTASQTVTITEPALLTLATQTQNSNCGQPDGEASVTPQGGTGPYTYSWNTTPVQTTQTATGLAAAQYIVTVTDANGCTQTAVAIVNNSNTLSTSIVSSSNVTCEATTCDGTATAAAAGGTGPYTYDWNTVPPQATDIATALCAGNYTVTITDANGCSGTASVTITECPPVIPEFTFYAPNTFTPNGDGHNDVFQGKGTYIDAFSMMIFDRWGNMIFKTEDLAKWWDGKANGGKDIAQEDVYVYIVHLTDLNKKKHKFMGHVSLVK